MSDRNLCENIFIETLNGLQPLMITLEHRLPELLRSRNIRLLVLDSVAAPFRGEFNLSGATQRAKYLHAIGCRLKELSVQFKLAIVCTNQVSDRMTNGDTLFFPCQPLATEYGMFPSAIVAQSIPTLGLAWSNEVTLRIMLSRKVGFSRPNPSALSMEDEDENQTPSSKRTRTTPDSSIRRQMHILLAPHLPPNSCDFIIVQDGVEGVGLL